MTRGSGYLSMSLVSLKMSYRTPTAVTMLISRDSVCQGKMRARSIGWSEASLPPKLIGGGGRRAETLSRGCPKTDLLRASRNSLGWELESAGIFLLARRVRYGASVETFVWVVLIPA